MRPQASSCQSHHIGGPGRPPPAASQRGRRAAPAPSPPPRAVERGAHGASADVSASRRGALESTARRPRRLLRRAIQPTLPGDLSRSSISSAWAVNVVGAITAAAHLGPRRPRRARTILLTGGMPEPVPGVTSLSLGKAGVRALTELLQIAVRGRGIHVATITVGGTVAPGTAYDPGDIAEHYWRLHAQPAGAWERRCATASGRAAARACRRAGPLRRATRST